MCVGKAAFISTCMISFGLRHFGNSLVLFFWYAEYIQILLDLKSCGGLLASACFALGKFVTRAPRAQQLRNQTFYSLTYVVWKLSRSHSMVESIYRRSFEFVFPHIYVKTDRWTRSSEA